MSWQTFQNALHHLMPFGNYTGNLKTGRLMKAGQITGLIGIYAFAENWKNNQQETYIKPL